MTPPVHNLYGLRVASELPLHQQRPADGWGAVDVLLVLGEPLDPTEEDPPGRVMVRFRTDLAHYTMTCTDDGGHVLRFHRVCDFIVAPDLAHVTARLVRGGDRGTAGVLAAGALLSFLLTVRGALVLHASAVQVGDHVLAMVGSSGMGKSTTAALLCARGALLVTDDVLRLDPDGDVLRCRSGTTELRMRKATDHLAGRFARRPALRITSDARTALRPLGSALDRLPLAAVVVPVPDRHRDRPEVTPLSRLEALMTLLRFPRLLGWEDPNVLARQLEELGDLVDRVPVYVARLPWGPPFSHEIAPALLDAVGLSDPRTS